MLLSRAFGERLEGINDLVFARNGDLYFTDKGETDLRDPSGRLDCLLDRAPNPNGLVLTPDESILYLAVTRANTVWRVPLVSAGSRDSGRLGMGRSACGYSFQGGSAPTEWSLTPRAASAAHRGRGAV